MPKEFLDPHHLRRDGTSQSGRHQAALDPDYVRVDERTLADLLAFAREYGDELKYFDDHDREDGTWNRFVHETGQNREDDDAAGSAELARYLEDAAAYVADPDRFTGARARDLGRPHFALFLTFLELLGHARDQLNTLTRRHLEYYYETVLRMTRKAATPDKVHALFRLAPSAESARLPAGTELQAGKDSAGVSRIYRTDHELVVNRGHVAQIRSVHALRTITGIQQARELDQGTHQDDFVRMLGIALGDPAPGDPLPPYQADHRDGAGRDVDFAFVLATHELLVFTATRLFMELFDLRELMKYKRQRDDSDSQWQTINRLLQKAARDRLDDSRYDLDPDDPRDFDANLAKAMGGAPNYDGLPNVKSIDDVYEQRNRDDVRAFIRDQLHFDRHRDFVQMMQIKVLIDGEWRAINDLLEQAHRRKQDDPLAQFTPADPTAFAANLTAAVGRLSWPQALDDVSDIDSYFTLIESLERYFFLSAEELSFIAAMAATSDETASGPTASQWHRVYRILADAHVAKVYHARRRRLADERGRRSSAAGFDAMLRYALGLGDEHARDEGALLLTRLEEYFDDSNHRDLETLRQMREDLEKNRRVSQERWDEAYVIVELTQRNREQLPVPIAEKVEWRNLYDHDDATQVAVSLGLPGDNPDADTSRWKTFGQFPGQSPPPASPDHPPAETLGWSISSPMLSLCEGQRTVTLTLGFHADGFDQREIAPLLRGDPSPFKVEISTEKGWIEPSSLTIVSGEYRALAGITRELEKPLKAVHFTLVCDADVDPIAPVAATPDSGPWPELRLLLRQIWDEDSAQFITHYTPFMDLVLVATHVGVAVAGLSSLQLRNDDTLIDPKKPFAPFGARPAVGSRFYVGHPELVVKKLDGLSFHIEWMGAPEDLTAHYKNYGIGPVPGGRPSASEVAIARDKGPAADAFKTNVSLVDNRVAHSLAIGAPLFATRNGETEPQQTISLTGIADKLTDAPSTYRYERSLELSDDPDLHAWRRYLRWDLTPLDFQHQTYPAAATRKSLAMAAAIANQTGPATPPVVPDTYHVNPPYTPTIQSLSVSYSASIEIVLGAGSDPATTAKDADRIGHIHPFGSHAIQSEAGQSDIRFLPQYHDAGELYIGIRDVVPRQNLAILMQMAEGSADPDLEPRPVRWSYLDGDRWHTLHDGNILSDSTRGLLNSGIIAFTLEPVAPSTRMPGDLYWLRAVIERSPDSVCDTVAIHAQAVSATFVDRNNAADHHDQPLAENSIKGFVRPNPRIAAIAQPYTSYGGKKTEQASVFYTRVAERLRHKQRALTMWDYERLVLERFPQLYKAKCLPANLARNPDDPGKVELIVIPDIRNQLPFDPFEPKAPANLLAEIEEYLADKVPAYATIEVRNAHYIPVMVRFGVRFKKGYDEGYYKKVLIDELNRFLSPWAYEDGADIVIGDKIYANSIVNFVDRREYVDYLASIRLFSMEDGLNFQPAQPTQSSDGEGYHVTTTRPDGVLVAARQHQIDLISDLGYKAESFTGINYMKLELDFIVD